VQPQAALGLVTASGLQLLTFSLAGPSAFATISLAKDTELATNTWLWLGIVVATGFVVVGEVSVTYRVVQMWRAANDTVNSYRYLTVSVTVALGVIYFGAHLLALLVYQICGWPQVLTVYTVIKSVAGFSFILIVLVKGIFDHLLLRLYKKYCTRRLAYYLKKLQAFYIRADQCFPANYRINPYDSKLLPSTENQMAALLEGLDDIRTLLWQGDALLKIEDEVIEPSPNSRISRAASAFNNEVYLWQYYLSNPVATARAALVLSTHYTIPDAVPTFISDNTSQKAQYFWKLAKTLTHLEQVAHVSNTAMASIARN
jgi:hypothetical protein